jgi:glycosyltransferase involved in cell wall biosynthesis
MRIGLNLLFVNPKLMVGTANYAIPLLKALSREDKVNTYFVFLNNEAYKQNYEMGDNFTKVLVPFTYSNVAIRYFWEQCMFPFLLKKYDLDMLHSMGNVAPLLAPVKKQVATIHDTVYNEIGKHMPLYKRFLLEYFVDRTAKNVDAILTVSNFSKSQLIKYLNVDPGMITVSHLASRPFSVTDDQKRQVLEKYQISNKYLIAFSSTSPHKNIDRLLQVFRDIRDRIDCDLVLVGFLPSGNNLEKLVVQYGIRERVIFTGFIDDAEVMPLLAAAQLFIYPSIYEGFGLVLADAQAAGVPVVCSNAGSLPEVGGEHVSYFDPLNTDDMANCILYTLQATDRKSIIDSGIENAKRFSWDQTARETLNVYRHLFDQEKRS